MEKKNNGYEPPKYRKQPFQRFPLIGWTSDANVRRLDTHIRTRMLANKLVVFYQRINEVKQILHVADSYQATTKTSISILTLVREI